MIGFSEAGMSQRRIGRILNRSCHTVNLWIQRYQTEGVQGLVVRFRSGRPRLTTFEQDMDIVVASMKNLVIFFKYNPFTITFYKVLLTLLIERKKLGKLLMFISFQLAL